jgi:uncharacterized protein
MPVFMQQRLPKLIDPWRLDPEDAPLEGEFPLAVMVRLSSLLGACGATVAFTLSSGVDEQGLRFLTGHAATQVQMVCRRCLGLVDVPLAVDFKLGLVRSEDETRSLPEYYDPLVVSEGSIVLSELIEDELILALPIAAMHEKACPCKAQVFSSTNAGEEEAECAKGPGPFAVLSALLKKTENQE